MHASRVKEWTKEPAREGTSSLAGSELIARQIDLQAPAFVELGGGGFSWNGNLDLQFCCNASQKEGVYSRAASAVCWVFKGERVPSTSISVEYDEHLMTTGH